MQDTKKPLAKSIEEKRLKARARLAAWRKANPERSKEHYRRYWRKKRGYYYAIERKDTEAAR